MIKLTEWANLRTCRSLHTKFITCNKKCRLKLPIIKQKTTEQLTRKQHLRFSLLVSHYNYIINPFMMFSHLCAQFATRSKKKLYQIMSFIINKNPLNYFMAILRQFSLRIARIPTPHIISNFIKYYNELLCFFYIHKYATEPENII